MGRTGRDQRNRYSTQPPVVVPRPATPERTDPMTTDTRPEVFSPDFLIDPYPQIEWLREEEPVHWVEDRSLWFVTRYEDIKRLMANAEIATPDRRAWEGYEAAP